MILRFLHLKTSLTHCFELYELRQIFSYSKLEFLLLKGSALAVDLYGDIGARVSKDIDLLVKPQGISRADEIFRAQGYLRTSLTPRQLRSHLKQCKDFVYWHPKKRICVELHWRLFQDWDCFDPFEVPHQEIVLGGQIFKTLSPEYNLLYLATHGCESGWAREQWRLDIVKLLEKYGASLDWGLIWREAERYDLTGPLEQALRRVSHCEEPRATRQSIYVWRLGLWWHKIALRKRWKNRLKAAWSLLIPRLQDFEALKLPDSLFFLYPLARPWLALQRNRQRLKDSSQFPL